MIFTTKWLTTVFPEYQGNIQSSLTINEVTTDSRVKTNHALFIPLIGENFDGHDHVRQAIDHRSEERRVGKECRSRRATVRSKERWKKHGNNQEEGITR